VRPTAVALALALSAAATRVEARRARGANPARATILLGGAWADVRWTDGDTFKVLSGPHAGRSARLVGVNALESFGPVHRWGGVPAGYYLELAKGSAAVAAAASVRCEAPGQADGYGRLLVSCPEVAEALVRKGHAMVFAVDAPAEPRLLVMQRDAQRLGVGMWRGGVPPRVPTSLHSADEPDLGPRGAYDRIVDTGTGVAEAVPHRRTYRTCEEVCVGEGPGRACMRYVPFARRYRDRPACLRPRDGA
jgi:micrococcal nuclease